MKYIFVPITITVPLLPPADLSPLFLYNSPAGLGLKQYIEARSKSPKTDLSQQLPALAAMHLLRSLLHGLQLPSARLGQQVSPSKQHEIGWFLLFPARFCCLYQDMVTSHKHEGTYTILGSNSCCRESIVQHTHAIHCLEGSRGCWRTLLCYHTAPLESFHQVLSSCQDIQDRSIVTE